MSKTGFYFPKHEMDNRFYHKLIKLTDTFIYEFESFKITVILVDHEKN